MARFAYIAIDAAGRRCRGELEASGRQDALEALSDQGLAPVSLSSDIGQGGASSYLAGRQSSSTTERYGDAGRGSSSTGRSGALSQVSPSTARSGAPGRGSPSNARSGAPGRGSPSTARSGVPGQFSPSTARSKKVSKQEVEDFCRELGSLLSAGISMSRALAILSGQSDRAGRAMIQSISGDVVGGMALADAMARCDGAFSSVQVAMVRAGETGGFLDVVLQQIADFQAAQRELNGRIQSALAYPIVLATVAVAVMIFLLTYFIPKFSSMFESLGGSLPALTRAIMAVSDALVHHGPALLALAVVAVLVLRRIVSGEAASRRLHGWLLSAPLIGEIVSRLALVRFCRMLSALVASGVPLVGSLRVAREALGNPILRETAGRAIDDVVSGRSLSNSLRAAGRLFPPSAIEMIAVAEEAGRLDGELARLADVYQARLNRKLTLMVALAEPLMLFVMAALVGAIVIGMLLPIFNLQDLIH